MPKTPADCRTMVDVRDGVDATDRQIVELLERRFGYMEAAARIKPDREAVRDEARKSAVVEAVRHAARQRNLPADALADWWAELVEISIAYETEEFDRTR